MASEHKIPFDLIAGFRGSGKTTLIRAMMETLWPKERVVFLLNECGIRQGCRGLFYNSTITDESSLENVDLLSTLQMSTKIQRSLQPDIVIFGKVLFVSLFLF